MKSILSIFLFCLLIVDVRSEISSSESSDCVGAAYTMSNTAPMNQVLIFCLNDDGRLTGKKGINTNGRGVNTPVRDPLSSQGFMVVHSDYLFVVNAGSDSLSMFAINPKDATQLTLISVRPTKGRFPVSVAVNSRYACVLTGGNSAGIRCFTYNKYGLSVISSFDRTVTLNIPQTNPPHGPLRTLSQIFFSADNLALIVAVKGYNTTLRGYLLFYRLTNNYATLSSTPSKQTPIRAVAPFGSALVGTNGLLVTDLGSQGVLTMAYSSASGKIKNSAFTPLNESVVGLICWPAYSRTVGNYYVIGTELPAVVELNINLASTSTPVKIIRYYRIPENVGALEETIVTVAGVDYLYVIGVKSQVITSYRLNGPGSAVFLERVVVQKDSPDKPRLAGMVTYVQARSHSPHH